MDSFKLHPQIKVWATSRILIVTKLQCHRNSSDHRTETDFRASWKKQGGWMRQIVGWGRCLEVSNSSVSDTGLSDTSWDRKNWRHGGKKTYIYAFHHAGPMWQSCAHSNHSKEEFQLEKLRWKILCVRLLHWNSMKSKQQKTTGEAWPALSDTWEKDMTTSQQRSSCCTCEVESKLTVERIASSASWDDQHTASPKFTPARAWKHLD